MPYFTDHLVIGTNIAIFELSGLTALKKGGSGTISGGVCDRYVCCCPPELLSQFCLDLSVYLQKPADWLQYVFAPSWSQLAFMLVVVVVDSIS